MNATRTPKRGWAARWRALALAPAVGVAALVAALSFDTGTDLGSDLGSGLGGAESGVSILALAAAALLAAVFSFLRWRVTSDAATGRLAVVLAVAGATGPALSASPAPAAVLLVAVMALAVMVGVVLRPPEHARWAGVLAGCGLVLLGVGSVGARPVGVGAGLVGAALLVGTAAVLLLRALEDQRLEVEELHRRLQAVEAGLRAEHARLHEINATVAGIASAQTLIAEGVGRDRTDALAVMMRAEVQRLQRLVGGQGPGRRRSVDLDDIIGQVALSHLARGRLVTWEPTGLRATGRADDIAEIVNVLLENAAVHGGPDGVSVRVTRDLASDTVAVTVSDQGPGVPPHLADRIFDWGVGRAGSPGQGIGLHVAADVARDLGGRLELVPATRGATFELRLSAGAEEVGSRVHDVRAS